MYRRLALFRSLPAIALALVVPAHASDAPAPAPDPKIAAILSSMGEVTRLRSVALAPDGQRLAYVIDVDGKPTLQLGSVAGGSFVPVGTQAAGSCSQSDPVWSPDSTRLAFIADCAVKPAKAARATRPARGARAAPADKPPVKEIWTVAASEPAAAHPISHLQGLPSGLSWSVDARTLFMLYVPGATREASALAASKPPSGEIGVDDVEVQHIASMDAAGGDVRLLTPDSQHVYEYSLDPSSQRVVYVAAPPPGDNNWWVAQIYLQDTLGRSAPTVLVDPAHVAGDLKGLQVAVPRISPDGSQVAFIGGLMSDQGATGGDVYIVPTAGGAPRNLTRGASVTTAWLAWSAPTRLTVAQIVGGSSRVADLAFPDASFAGTPDPVKLWDADASIGDGRLAMSLSSDKSWNTVAYVQSTFDKAPEVMLARLSFGGDARTVRGAPVALTALNAAHAPSWGKAESVVWKNEGHSVQGWLLYPADYDASKKYPMIVYVHGGPGSAVLPGWPGVGFGPEPLSAMGYFVLMANPRGSFGQGEAFVQANRKDFGYGDLRDILKGVDEVEKNHPVDDKRLGLTGWSYGGFMTMFAVTQTHRFKAAVAGAGLANWQSYYGQNQIDQWMTPFFGASVYDDPKVYAKSSAINFIKDARTPTLVVVGDRDAECPAPQSYEFWHALRAQGVPTKLVVYPGEGHSFQDPAHRRDVLARALDWFATYLK
jgi:dipeptidyl aminopeptidase/acylaminoacyl peptidase